MRSQLLGVAKRKIGRSIVELSSVVQFAVIYGESRPFAGSPPARKYPATGHPTAATPKQKRGALNFLAAGKVQGWTTIRVDLLAALKSAEKLTSRRKTIIYVGDGVLQDGRPWRQVVQEITNANTVRARIHTIGVSVSSLDADEFLKALAAKNGGTYKRAH